MMHPRQKVTNKKSSCSFFWFVRYSIETFGHSCNYLQLEPPSLSIPQGKFGPHCSLVGAASLSLSLSLSCVFFSLFLLCSLEPPRW